jgi:hypothetical protein
VLQLRKCFKEVRPHKNPVQMCFSRKCKDARKSEDSGSHHKIWTVLHHPIYRPSGTLSFSYIRSPEGCDLWYEVWNTMMWFTQWGLGYASSTRHGIDKVYIHLFLVGTRP